MVKISISRAGIFCEASNRESEGWEQNIMAKPLNIRQTYIDKFDPKDYLQTFYMKGEGMLFGEWTDFALQNLHDTFNKGESFPFQGLIMKFLVQLLPKWLLYWSFFFI